MLFSDKNYLSVRTHRHAYHLLELVVAGLKRGAYPFRLGKQIGRQEGSREEEEFERGFHKAVIERPRPTDRNTACPDIGQQYAQPAAWRNPDPFRLNRCRACPRKHFIIKASLRPIGLRE